jgi:hypothetical protein
MAPERVALQAEASDTGHELASGRVVVIKNYQETAARSRDGVLIAPREGSESAPLRYELGISLKSFKKGDEGGEEASLDRARVLTITRGQIALTLFENGNHIEHTLGKDDQIFIGKGVAYSFIVSEDAEIMAAQVPTEEGFTSIGDGKSYVVHDVWETGKARNGWTVGHFIKNEEGESLTDAIEAKAGIHADHNQHREVWSQGRHGMIASFVVEGQHTLEFRKDDGTTEIVTAGPGTMIFWDNNVPHRWDSTPGTKVLSFRTPSLQPNQSPIV